MRSAAFAVSCALAVAACAPRVTVPPGVLSCSGGGECPAPFLCAPSLGRCVEDGPCIASGDAVPNGRDCAAVEDGVCVDGACVAPFCGDARVDAAREECDPAVGGAGCTEDCKVAACGNGVIDGRESCDDDTRVCVGCVLTCGEPSASGPAAECDGDLTEPCECIPEREVAVLTSDDQPLPSGTVVLGDIVYFRYLAGAVHRYDTVSRELREGPAELREVAAAGDQLYGLVRAALATAFVRLDPDTMEPVETLIAGLGTLAPFATDGETFYFSDADGLHIRHVDGDERVIAGVSSLAESILCGQRLIVDDDQAGRLAILDDLAGDALRTLEDSFPSLPGVAAACWNDTPVWVSATSVVTEVGGRRTVLTPLPLGASHLIASLAFVGDVGFVTLSPAGVTATYAFHIDERVLRPRIRGVLVAALPDLLLAWDVDTEPPRIFAHPPRLP